MRSAVATLMRRSRSAVPVGRVLYQHRQTGWALLLLACVPFTCLGTIWIVTPPVQRSLPHGLLPGLVILALVLLFGFSSMSIVVSDQAVMARTGIGLVRRTIALASIAGVEVTRSRWYEGWGVHWTRRGMLYNVSGFGAVRVTLVDGRSVMLGTDDADRLASIIRLALARRAGLHARS